MVVSSSSSSLTNSREIFPSPSLVENQRWQEKVTSSPVLESSTVTCFDKKERQNRRHGRIINNCVIFFS